MNFNTIENKLLTMANKVSKYCVGMEGNISSKIDDIIIIKASGSKLNELTINDLVCINKEDVNLTNPSKKASMELGFHRFLLGFDNINFVAHTHPTNTVKILCSNLSDEFSKNRLFPDQIVFNGKKSCLVPYAKPGEELTKLIKLFVNSFIKDEGYFPKLILLKNHGIISCGETIDECIISSDICEKSAEIFIGAYGLNKINFLHDSEINDLVEDENEIYRKKLIK